MDGLTVRCYRPGDLDACRALWAELVEHHRRLYGDASIGGEQPGLHFDEHLARLGAERIWVAELDGRAVALAGLQLLDEAGREAEIEPLVVTHALRGGGAGRALVAAVVSEARALGVRYLGVRPVARNAGALSFFHGQGFDILGQLELFMDLRQPPAGPWQPGPELEGRRFRC